ncbi:MAG: microcin C ABC transporter permease YejB [Acidimicrobiia bacterium]|nr:microcin C ABC transporter permease YejB [Acidimicrobiia bacterium]
MLAYVLRRLLLIVPTLFGIMVVNFIIVQAAPGGPVEQMIAELQGTAADVTGRFAGTGAGEAGERAEQRPAQTAGGDVVSKYRGARGLEPELIEQIEKLYGFDKPAHERFLIMMRNYLVFDFGDSFFRDRKVVDLVLDKLPVSISLGLWTTLLVYLISIPLGIAKAVRDGSRFDVWTSAVVIVGYAIPGFLFAILLIVLFAGGSFWNVFPLRGLTSPDWANMDWPARIADYFWHIALPIAALVVGGFASLTMLTKNSFLEEINKQYVTTARAKGATERGILYGHIFRNAMLIVIAGFPGAFIGVLFTGALLVEVIFSLDGLGLLGFEAALKRDYPVMFGSLYFFTLLGLLMNLIGDLAYHAVDPRIDFEARET